MTDQELYDHHQLKIAELPPVLRHRMIAVVRAKLQPADAAELRQKRAADPLTWWHAHHFAFGMQVRNALRHAGHGEHDHPIDNLDEYWVPIVEAALDWPTLEEYFRAELGAGKIDHWLRVTVEEDCVRFYIHPFNRAGDTQDYEVRGNQLQHDPRISRNGE